jgi:MscS family membrane protein
VVIGDVEGTVEDIGFRSTRIRTFYNSLVTIPNGNLVRATVDNYGRRKYRRWKTHVAITYDTPPDRIEAFCEGIRELIRKHPYTRKDYYMVYFNQFAASSLNILLYAFHETPDWATELRERHRLFVDIVRLAKRLGVEFAFPTQTVHLASAPAGISAQPEPASPPHETGPAPAGVGFHKDAVRLGRAEAEAIMESMWKDEVQPPVNFGDPDRILPE